MNSATKDGKEKHGLADGRSKVKQELKKVFDLPLPSKVYRGVCMRTAMLATFQHIRLWT